MEKEKILGYLVNLLVESHSTYKQTQAALDALEPYPNPDMTPEEIRKSRAEENDTFLGIFIGSIEALGAFHFAIGEEEFAQDLRSSLEEREDPTEEVLPYLERVYSVAIIEAAKTSKVPSW